MDRNQMAIKLEEFKEQLSQAKTFDSFLFHKVIRPALDRLDALDIKFQALLELSLEKKLFTDEEFKAAVAKSNTEFREKTKKHIKDTAENGSSENQQDTASLENNEGNK